MERTAEGVALQEKLATPEEVLRSLPENLNWEIAHEKWQALKAGSTTALLYRADEARKHDLPKSAYLPLFDEAKRILDSDAARYDDPAQLLDCPWVLRELAKGNSNPRSGVLCTALLFPVSFVCFAPLLALLLPVLLLLSLWFRLCIILNLSTTSRRIAFDAEMGRGKRPRLLVSCWCISCYTLCAVGALAIAPLALVFKLLILSVNFRAWPFVVFRRLLPNLCRSRRSRELSMCRYSWSALVAFKQQWAADHPGVATGQHPSEVVLKR